MVIALYHPYWGSSAYHDVAFEKLVDLVAHGRQNHQMANIVLYGDFNGLSQLVPFIETPSRNHFLLDLTILSSSVRLKKVPPSPTVTKIQFRKMSPNARFYF